MSACTDLVLRGTEIFLVGLIVDDHTLIDAVSQVGMNKSIENKFLRFNIKIITNPINYATRFLKKEISLSHTQ